MQLNQRVKVQRRAKMQDAAGQVKDNWKTLAEVWASVRPLGSREYFAASGQRAEITHEIMLRFGVSLRPKDRILMQVDGDSGPIDRIFDVVAPMNVGERNRYLRAMSIEHADRAE